MKNSKGSVPMFLSDDLIKEILVRLPVRSLLRLKCVCKNWFSLICDPQFAQYHFDMAIASTHRFLVHSYSNRAVDYNSLDIDAPSHCDSVKLVLDIPFPSPIPVGIYVIRFVSSCRGLILLTVTPFVNFKYPIEFVVWNPSTNFQKRIPGIVTNLIGFGYDSLSDDYLLVNVQMGLHFSRFEWLSFRTKSWAHTVLAGVRYETHFSRCGRVGVFMNDALHWLVTASDHWRVTVFDLRERNLSEILLPHELAVTFKEPTTVARLKLMAGCLCLSVVEEEGLRISMWMMKQYKVQSSWIKLLVITCNSGPLLLKFNPICFTRDGQVLGSYANRLVKLTDKGELLEHYSPVVVESGVEFCVYKESLLAVTPSEFEETIES